MKTKLRLETSYLSASEYDLSRHKDEKYDFRFDHTIDKPREKLKRGQLRFMVPKAGEQHTSGS